MHSDNARAEDQRGKKILKFAGIVVIAVLVFFLGMGVGSGTIMFGTRTQANKEAPTDLDYATVEQVYDLLRVNYDGKLDTEKLLDGLKDGLARATGDPYTEFFNKAEAKEFDGQLNGSFTGIGAELGKDDKGNLIIVSPIEGFPASKAGLRPQDIIVSIDGTTTNDMAIDEAVTRIRGEKDTKVTLRILRNKSEDLSFTITRDDIKIPSVKWELLEGNIGYIRVSQFGQDASDLFTNAANDLKKQGAKKILLDLRGNPGGLLSAAVDISSLWLDEGKDILQEKRGGIVVESFKAEGSAPLKGMPTVVLINQGSASASEIVAGALKDNNAATLFGEKSYGKGSVQEIQKIPGGGGEIKITIARWYRPSGQNIDKKGIAPDREIKMTEEDYKANRDPQKDAALEFLRK